MNVKGVVGALTLVARTLAGAFRPSPPIAPSRWAADNLIVPDGEYAGSKFDLALTPHLVEILDHLGPDSPVNEIDSMKSAQSGFTLVLLAAIAYSIDRDPCDMLVVQPTDSTLADFNSQKLGRMIEKSPALAAKVAPQTARSGKASTTYEKKYGSNSLYLAISNSSADLSSKTIKKAFLDEIDRYPDDVDGQGSPLALVAARQTMFLMSGTWKRLCISTPTIKGESAIEARYEAGDKRRWFVRCPHCSPAGVVLDPGAPRQKWEFVFEFGPNFRYERTHPHQAYYVCPANGCVIEGWQKVAVYRSGRWIATAPGPGRHPSYHFDALASPFVPWDVIAAEYIAAADDPEKLKPFYNLKLGLPFDVTPASTDHEALQKRALLETYERGKIPPDALLVTITADVQMRGIYYVVLAWTPDRRCYVIEADYLDGATTDHDDGAFASLSDLYRRTWPDAFGNRWPADEFGVDAGYRTQVVYTWSRLHPGVRALKGEDGWHRPPLGVATDQDIDYRGRKIKGGAKQRAVGTWPLKGKFYTYLACEARVGDNGVIEYPRGYIHFGPWLDTNYYKQITAEFLADVEVNGRKGKRWKQRQEDNHFLDCHIYGLALADAYLSTYTADDWAHRARERLVPADMVAPDLFSPRLPPPADHAAPAPADDAMTRMLEQLAAMNRGT